MTPRLLVQARQVIMAEWKMAGNNWEVPEAEPVLVGGLHRGTQLVESGRIQWHS